MVILLLSQSLELQDQVIQRPRRQTNVELLYANVDFASHSKLVNLVSHIRNTPKGVSSTGAPIVAANASPSTSLVCAGSMIPSSHSRAVA